MSVLKGLNFTAVVRSNAASPEQQRRTKLIAHLQEQLGMLKAEMAGTSYVVKKRRWQLAEDGHKHKVEGDKRLKRWWATSADGSLVLAVRWGSKLIEFERGKPGIVATDLQALVQIVERLIKATEAGELDGMIASINKQRAASRKRAA